MDSNPRPIGEYFSLVILSLYQFYLFCTAIIFTLSFLTDWFFI